MTYERRDDPVDPVDPENETRVVERQTYVEREQPVAEPAPAQPAGSQVNVNSGQPAYVETTGTGPLYYVRRVLSLLFGILAVLLGLRILLLLLVANQQNAIVDFIYGVTEPFVAPVPRHLPVQRGRRGRCDARRRRARGAHRLAADLPAADGDPAHRRPRPGLTIRSAAARGHRAPRAGPPSPATDAR